MKDIGKRIKEQRKKKNITQEAMAKTLGVTAQAISKWENGQTSPDISLIMPICDLLGLGADELLGGNRQKELNEKYWEYLPLGHEFILLVCEEALKEFPDDIKWLERRFLAEQNLARSIEQLLVRSDADEIKRNRYLSHARTDINTLTNRDPENETYKHWRAEIYIALGLKDQAKKILYKTESSPSHRDYRNNLLSRCLEGDELTKHRQTVLQQSWTEFFVGLRDYNTLESLSFADELLDKYFKEDAAFSYCRWILDIQRARIYLDEGNIEEYVRCMTGAYDKVKLSDALDRDGLYKSPFLDRVMHHKSPVPEFEQFLLNDFSNDALHGLKCKMVAENIYHVPLIGYNWKKFVNFLYGKGRKSTRYLSFSCNFDTTEEEWDEHLKAVTLRQQEGEFKHSEHILMIMQIAKRLLKQNRLTGFVVNMKENYPVGFCNCGDRDKYLYLGIRREPRSSDDRDLAYTADKLDTVPKEARVFSIVDMAIHTDFRWCGIEKYMINHACEWAKNAKCEYVEAYFDTALLFMLKGKELESWITEYKKAGFDIVKDLSENKFTKLVLQKKL